MEKKQSKPKAENHVPTPMPFDELPDWLTRTLNSRLITKKLPKIPDTVHDRFQHNRAETPEKKINH